MLNLVTGKIGSGKSQVIKILQEKGFQTFKCDDVAKGMLAVPEVFQFLVQLFGKDVLNDEGCIDRNFLREAFMKEEYQERFRRYENYIANESFKWIEKQIGSSKEPIFIECAWIKKYVTFITHHSSTVRIFIVNADEEVRNERALQRGVTKDLLDATNKIQNWELTKSQKFGNKVYAIDNSGSISELFDNVQRTLEQCSFTTDERETVFQRMYNNSRDFVKPNVHCYMYHNMVGCAKCPFPCQSSDKYFEEMLKEQMEKGIKFSHGTVIHEG